MSRIVLATFGSLGDLNPYLAVGAELVARGHAVTLASHAEYRDRAASAGMTLHAVPPSFEDYGDVNAALREAMDLRRGSEVVLRRLVLPFLERSRESMWRASEGADVLVDHVLTLTLPLLAEARGIPRVRVLLQPVALFSAYDPPVMPALPFAGLVRQAPPWAWNAIWSMARLASRSWFEPLVRMRADMGLPPRREHAWFDPPPAAATLAWFSRELASPQPDWPPGTQQTGFPFWTGPGHDTLSAKLEAFLAAGEPPVVFTLGSSAVFDAGPFYTDAARIARTLGVRAVLLTGERHGEFGPPGALNAVPPALLSDRVLTVPYAPFAALFPRARALVHQGGVGTTGAALASGKPSLIMPYSHDQPDNAGRCARLGVARVIPRAHWSESNARRELGRLLADESAFAKAAEVGERVRAEHGTEHAADAIEAVLKKR